MNEFDKTKEKDPNGEPDFSVSPQFKKDLQAMFTPKGAIPPEIDRRILHSARRSIVRRRVWKWVRYPAAAAAVAAVWVCAAIWDRPGDSDFIRIATNQILPEDIDHNGVVDIRDALCLARKVESQDKLDGRWDINRDGTINRGDADSVAMVAVNLSRQGVL